MWFRTDEGECRDDDVRRRALTVLRQVSQGESPGPDGIEGPIWALRNTSHDRTELVGAARLRPVPKLDVGHAEHLTIIPTALQQTIYIRPFSVKASQPNSLGISDRLRMVTDASVGAFVLLRPPIGAATLWMLAGSSTARAQKFLIKSSPPALSNGHLEPARKDKVHRALNEALENGAANEGCGNGASKKEKAAQG
jgi:hypothetical protein